MIGAHDVMPKWRGIPILLSSLYMRNRSSTLAPKRQGLVEEEILSAAFESQNAEIA